MAQDIFEQIDQIKDDINKYADDSAEMLEAFRIRFLGTKNIIKPLFSLMGQVEAERKKEFGQALNALKVLAEEKFELSKSGVSEGDKTSGAGDIDLTAPAEPF